MENYTGFHGTSTQAVDSIKNAGFNRSTSYNEWLGDGVYFFIEGISCPISNAREWAINTAWDNRSHSYKYNEYSILKTEISGERILDLRSQDDLGIFQNLRSHILERYLRELGGFKQRPDPDTFLCNSVSKSLRLDILIHNLYIKTKAQRIKKLNSRIPNATVLCAKSNSVINRNDIEVIESEGI